MVNIFNIKDHTHKIMFPNIVAKEVEKMLPNTKREEKVKAISRILENNNVQHTIVRDIIVVHDLRIMDECCEFAWYMDLAAIVERQMTKKVMAKILDCHLPTIIQQDGVEIVLVYTCTTSRTIIVVTTIFDELPDSNKQDYQVVNLSSDAKIL